MQISIYLTADNITRYDVWWIDSPVFNNSSQAFLHQNDIHKTRFLFKIHIHNIGYQLGCLAVWHLTKSLGDTGDYRLRYNKAHNSSYVYGLGARLELTQMMFSISWYKSSEKTCFFLIFWFWNRYGFYAGVDSCANLISIFSKLILMGEKRN